MNHDSETPLGVSGSPLAQLVEGERPSNVGINKPAAPPKLYTLGEAAKLLGFTSRRTLENLRFRKRDPASIKLPSGGVRYTLEALSEWAGLPDDVKWGDSFAHPARMTDKQRRRRERDLERQRARRAEERRAKQ